MLNCKNCGRDEREPCDIKDKIHVTDWEWVTCVDYEPSNPEQLLEEGINDLRRFETVQIAIKTEYVWLQTIKKENGGKLIINPHSYNCEVVVFDDEQQAIRKIQLALKYMRGDK